MKRILYYPIHEDEFVDVFEGGIRPDEPFGSIILYDNRENAYSGCQYLNGYEPDFIVPVLVDEASVTSETCSIYYKPITIYDFKGMLSINDISLNENDIYLPKE